MKKFFTILGIIFAVIIVILVIAAAIFIPRTLKLDREATAYLQKEIPRIVISWDSQELVDRATPELLAAGKSREDIDRFFEMFKRLGSFRHMDKPQGSIASFAYSSKGAATFGNYTVKTDFENGKARIEIQLRRVGNTWKINGFRIFSDALLPTKT